MKKSFKNTLRRLLISLNLPVTKNISIDIMATRILKDVLNNNSNCIDIGTHDGDFTDRFLDLAPEGRHYAFEPIPELYTALRTKYAGKRVEIFPYALSETTGKTSFNYVKNAPAYSGIKKRDYDINDPEIDIIQVETRTLDSIIPPEERFDVLKIDVEGAEYNVLKGARKTLTENDLVILFEFGKGAANHYNVTTAMMYDLMQEMGYSIYRLEGYRNKKQPLTLEAFNRLYDHDGYYFYIADKK